MLVDELEEGEDKQLLQEKLRQGNVDEVDELVLENKYKGNVKSEDSGYFLEEYI